MLIRRWWNAVRDVPKLMAEIERLRKMIDDPKFFEMEIDHAGAVCLKVEHWAAKIMALSFAESFGEAKNWIAFQVGPLKTAKGYLTCTIQKEDGETPLYQLRKRDEQLAKLVGIIQRLDASDLTTTSLTENEWAAIDEASQPIVTRSNPS